MHDAYIMAFANIHKARMGDLDNGFVLRPSRNIKTRKSLRDPASSSAVLDFTTATSDGTSGERWTENPSAHCETPPHLAIFSEGISRENKAQCSSFRHHRDFPRKERRATMNPRLDERYDYIYAGMSLCGRQCARKIVRQDVHLKLGR